MSRGKRGQKPEKKRERGEPAEAPSLARIYEGPASLNRMLGKAGAQVDVAGLVARFSAAIAEEKLPPEVIPSLFEKEPRFGGPEEAMRLYGNLFGVWDLLVAGTDPAEVIRGSVALEPDGLDVEAEDDGRMVPTGPTVELPPRGSIAGKEVPYEVVEGTWQEIADLPPRERTRKQDRYANTQSELAEWARTVEGLDGAAQESLEYLCFELAEMFDNAFGDRFGAVRYRQLETADGNEADGLQPYAADYVAETLDEAEDEGDEPLSGEEREILERYARRAIVAMTAATKEG